MGGGSYIGGSRRCRGYVQEVLPPCPIKIASPDRELEKHNQAFKDVESCRNHLAKHKPAPAWMFWRWFLILNLGTVLTVSAMSIEAREAELVWRTMWEDRPKVIDFRFDAELREFKARVR